MESKTVKEYFKIFNKGDMSPHLKAIQDSYCEFAESFSNHQNAPLIEENKRLIIGILKVRDELVKEDFDAAYHELYKLACPNMDKTNPWAKFEKLLSETEQNVQ